MNQTQINQMPTTPEEDEAMRELFEKMGQDLTPPHPFKDAFKVEPVSLDKWMEHANKPQLSGEIPHNPDLPTIINNICTQLQLLATVIQAKAQPNTTPPEGNQSLQETIELVLQQSDWFAEMVRQEVMAMDFDDTLEGQVERYCENYFSYTFDPRDHFDVDEAVADRVDDKIDQAVENYLSNATLTIERG